MAKGNTKRRVAVVTGTRAEYGAFVPVMKAIRKHPKLELQVVVTGMHLLKRFGSTIQEIEADGWRIDGKVRLQDEKDSIIGQSRGLGRAITGLTNIFHRLRTDIVLVLGDRVEALAAAAAGATSHLIIGHIHGGDVATGVLDDAYRHAITKLSHIHFAASKGAYERILRLGEESYRIYQTGSPAIDDLAKTICKNIPQLNQWADFDVREDFFLIVQHPAGASAEAEKAQMEETLHGCRRKGFRSIVLYPNCDPGFSGIIEGAQSICKEFGWPMIANLPRSIYLGLLERARVLVGNSSSGIIEAGYLNVDVVNVGHRQQGREHGENVLDVDYGRRNVSRAIDKILKQSHVQRAKTRLYGNGKSGQKIANILGKIKIDGRFWQKKLTY